MTGNKKISPEEVKHIAELARIYLTEEEKEEFSKELSDILVYIGQLQEINTENVEPVSQITGMVNVFREDVIKECDEKTRRRIIDDFPEEKDGYIKVKQVM
jgi:aspartyl-tRNA(Asn)/glutamyl-tRNA(Gln) amidotransferase subunit C